MKIRKEQLKDIKINYLREALDTLSDVSIICDLVTADILFDEYATVGFDNVEYLVDDEEEDYVVSQLINEDGEKLIFVVEPLHYLNDKGEKRLKKFEAEIIITDDELEEKSKLFRKVDCDELILLQTNKELEYIDYEVDEELIKEIENYKKLTKEIEELSESLENYDDEDFKCEEETDEISDEVFNFIDKKVKNAVEEILDSIMDAYLGEKIEEILLDYTFDLIEKIGGDDNVKKKDFLIAEYDKEKITYKEVSDYHEAMKEKYSEEYNIISVPKGVYKFSILSVDK